MTGPFPLDNGNTPPTALVQPVVRQVGIVQIDFVLVDAEADLVDVLFEYSTDLWVTPLPMTLPPPSVTKGLSSSPVGENHTVFWDSVADLGPSAAVVQIRATPSDLSGSGTPGTTPDSIVGNDAPVVSCSHRQHRVGGR